MQKAKSDRLLEWMLYCKKWQHRVAITLGIICLGFISLILNRAANLPPVFGNALGYIAFGFFSAGFMVLIVTKIQQAFVNELMMCQTGPNSLRHLKWRQLELVCAELFRARGFDVKHRSDDIAEADGGVDLKVYKDGVFAIVQCKRWTAEQVDVKLVRELLGVMLRMEATRAYFITTTGFTADARQEAYGQPIELIDGPKLWQMIQETRSEDVVREVSLQQGQDYKDGDPCPACDGTLVKRSGGKILGCSNYSAKNCRVIWDIEKRRLRVP